MNVVIRNPARPELGVAEQLGSYGVATLHEALGRRGLFSEEMQRMFPGTTVTGTAVTVLCAPGDNLMVHAAIEVCQPGDVLVVAFNGPPTRHAMIGELLATSLRAHGVRGAFVDGAVRDWGLLREMGFPVWARYVHALGATKFEPGSVNVPVISAGTMVHPGDIIVGDDDGVVCVPSSTITDALKAASERTERETATRERLRSGDLGLDLYELRPTLKSLGVSYLDTDHG